MAKKNLFQRIKDWFTGGNNSSNRASSYRGSSNTRATNAFVGQRSKEEDERRKAEQEKQRKIKEAFATSAQKARDKERKENDSYKRIAKASNSSKAWKKTAEKELGVTDAKSNRLAQLDQKYWQKQEEHSAKYNPVGLSMAKGAVSGVTMNADKLLVNSDKDAKARQEKVQKIMEKNGGEKAVKRANVVGELAGTMATFGLGTAGAKGAVEGSKAVAKATSKLANTEIVRKASARAIEKGLAKGSIEEVSQQLAKKLATEFGADVAVDNTLGLIDATTRASLAEDGEKGKEFLTNVGINALATGTLDLAPTLVKGLKGAKSLKNVEKKEIEKALEKAGKAELPQQAEKEAVDNAVGKADIESKTAEAPLVDVANDAEKPKPKKPTQKWERFMGEWTSSDSSMKIYKNNGKYVVQETTQPNLTPTYFDSLNEAKVYAEGGWRDAYAKAPAESPTSSVLEQDLKNIEEGKPLEPKVEMPTENAELPTEMPTAKPVEPPAPKVEAQPNGAVADDVMDGIGQDPEVRKMFDEAQLEDDRRKLNSTNGYIDVSTFGSRTEIKNKSIEQFLGREAFDEVRPASEHQLNGHFGTKNDVSYSEVMALKEKQELAKKLADENGERVTDSSITSYAMSKDKEFQDEAVAKMDELGITERDGEMNVLERMSNRIYDPKYKKLSYREMCAVAREDVYNNPKAVMNHLYSLMQKGDRFTAVDLALSAQLIEYGDRFAVQSASDLGHMFLMDYANEMGRISGMYQFISKQWNLLSGEKKLDYLYNQVQKFAKDMELGSIDDLKQSIQDAYASRVSESGEDIYENLMKNRGEGNYQYDLLTIDRDKVSVFDVLVDNVINSTDENYTKLAKAELWQSINGTVEPTFLNNLMTWRYFSMLGNPATHMRNLTGNFVFAGVRSVSDVFTTGIENIMHSMGKIDFKSRAILTPSEIKDILGGKGTYGSVIDKALEADLEGIMKSSQGYKNQLIDEFGTANLNLAEKGIRKGTDIVGNALEFEDKQFVAFNYQKSLGQFLKANGYGSGAGNKMLKANGGRFENDEAILEAGRNWARQDAQEATFRNFNDLSRMLNNAVKKGEKRNATALEKGIAVGTNAIVPFTTTPINILVQGARFSPLGFTKHAVGLMKATSPEEYIKHAEGLGAGLTGTGILALGMWLSSNNSESVAGIQFMSSAGDDERAKALKRAGYQDYSVVFTDGEGHGISYSLEWCSPIAQTLFTGVEIGRMMRGGLNAGNETTGFDRLGNITQIASRMIDPTLQMSVLQGVNTFIEGANNDSGISGAVSGVTALAQNYLGSLIPSFMGALARTVSPYDYNLVGTSSTEMGSNLEYTINAQKAKLPFLATAMLAPKVNEKGEIVGKKENAGDYAKAFAKNMLSVGKYQKIDMTDADRDAIKTYDEAIADGIDPDTAKQVFAKVDYSTEKKIGKTDKKYGLKKETLNLDKWERATSQQNRSKNGADAMDALLESKAWNAQVSKDNRESRQAELRAKAPKSTSEALDILVNTPEYKGANADEKVAMRNAILDKATKYSANKETYMNRGHSEAEYDFLEKVPAKVQHAYNTSGLSDILTKEQIVKATKLMAKVSYSEDGTRRTYYSKKSMLNGLAQMEDLTEEQKKALYNTFKNKNAKGYGQSGSGGRRRSGGSSSSKSSTKSQAKLSAFKPSVKKSDFKSITKNINQDYGKVKREFGLTDAELQAIIKQANRDSLSLRGK